MNKLSTEKRRQVVAALVEGNGIRATVRMTGVSKNTIAKLLVELGAACADYLDKALVNLNCKRIQCDEIWSFVGAKEDNVREELRGTFGVGNVWTWVAMDADSKLIAAWTVGGRDAGTAYGFMQDLANRLTNRVQLTTDGHRAYLSAVEDALGSNVDYAMLVKLYGSDRESEVRYSPGECIGCREIVVSGKPDPQHISTSYIERQNLTMRMQMRRFTRLTNGFSKKLENHIASIALHYMHYNFCRVHQTLRVTPAMEAGVADHIWTITEMLSILDSKQSENKAA
ncbi:MAG: IS1 family transposase [Acidobacteriia bacterium]|nr:IS1 family transposase [Terriglobia bacterium]